MGNHRVRHDVAFAEAQALLDVVIDCILPEERKDALDEFYRIALRSLEAYDLESDRLLRRLKPGIN
jgi:hypothetical protein